MKNSYLLISLLICLAACGGSADKPVEQIRTFPADEVVEVDTVTSIKFEEFTLEVIPFANYDEDHLLDKIQHDSVIVWGEVGATIEGAIIKVNGYEQLKDLKIEQRYETSVTIMDEGPHCDLLDWKHYDSPWITLRPIDEGLYKGVEYTMKEHEKFPKVTAAELKAAVEKHCGEAWSKQVSHPQKYPAGVGISTYFLKISGIKDGKPFIKNIIIDSPLGC